MSKRARLLLRVTTPNWIAGAVWERGADGIWRCTRAAPILAWMVKTDARTARERLELMRYTWEWLNVPENPDEGLDDTRQPLS